MTDPAIVQDGASQIGLGGFTPEMAGEEIKLKAQKELMKQAQSQATKRGEAEIMSQYGPILSKPYEEFKPTQETMSGFAALGSLLMVAGGMMGTGGKMASIGAMNNIAGMLKGYQTGRQDLYEKERQQYESNMKAFEKNHALMKEAFDRALKMAPYNLTKAQNQLRTELTALGAKIPAAAVDKHGLIQTANDHSVYSANLDNKLRSLSQIDKSLTDIEAKKAVGLATSEAEKAARQKRLDEALIAEREATRSKTEAETQSKKDAAVRKGLSEQEYNTALALSKNPENITTEQERDLVAALTGTVYTVNKQPKADEVVGQRKFVKGIIGDESKDLSAKELAKVASTIEATKLSFDLADAVQKTPEAAGVIGRTLSWFDKLRVSPTDEANPDILAAQAASDPTLFEGVPQDKISEVQNIQKIVVDVINARALAASGGSRMLISEFNAQKGVLGLQNLSPTSAPYVYRSLGTRDAKGLRQYGLSDDAIKKIIDSSQPRPKPSTSAKSIPAGLPENSQLIGKSSDGKSYVYQSPDGKKYAVPIEAQ